MSVGGKIWASGFAGSQIPVKALLPGAKKIRRQGWDPLQRVMDAQAVVFGDTQGVALTVTDGALKCANATIASL